jgi:resuscitation-promoting factor RpfB
MRVRATRLRRLRIRKAIGHTSLTLGVLAAGLLYLSAEKTVTLVVDGRPESVRTLSGSVGQLLDTKGITLGPEDQVLPPPATSLADGMTVVVVDGGVATATVQQDSQGVGVWVVDGVVGPFGKLIAQPTESLLSVDPSVGPSREVNARVVVKGKEHDVLTNATTVRELLSAMGITPDGNDRVQPSPSTPLHQGVSIRFAKVRVATRTKSVVVPFTTFTTYSSKLAPGAVRMLRGGVPGSMFETFQVRIVNGRVVSKTLLSRHVVSAAVAAMRVMGRARPQPGSQVGEASWYDAPGTGLTAASPWLPFGTVVTVTNRANGKSVRVVINDRGPFGGRIIDLSPEAFSAIASLGAGVAQVRLTW